MKRDPSTEGDAIGRALFEGGEMAALMRAFDWSKTPLGPLEHWPLALRSPLGICLGSNFPIAIYWGSELALLYNDAWSPILGDKHPWALGRAAREVWPEIWGTIGALFEQVLHTGRATRSQDQLLPMHRRGYTEECWFDYTFSPIRGEDGTVQGIFNAVIETTFRHIGERRTALLRDLVEQTANVASAEQVCARAAAAFGTDAEDLPFCLLYLVEGDAARLAGAAGLAAGTPASPQSQSLAEGAPGWPLAETLAGKGGLLVEGLAERFGVALPGGPWPEACERVLLVTIASSAALQPAGVLVAGISPRLALDSEYRAFVERAAASVGAAVAGARAMEEERARAEALAELDRAKTISFNARELLARAGGVVALARARGALAKSAAALHDSEARHRFLVELNAATQGLVEPRDILAVTARLLGQALDADRCLCALIDDDEDTVDVFGSYVRDDSLERLEGRHRLADFGTEQLRLYRAGEPFVIDDIESDSRIAAQRPAYRALGTIANLSVGLVEAGKLVAALAVHQQTPRRWSEVEVQFAQDVAARSWEAFKRARTQLAVAASEQRFRELAEAMPQIVYVSGADGGIEYVNRQWQEYTGQSGADAQHLPAVVHADDLQSLLERWQQAMQNGTPLSTEFRLRRSDGEYRWFLTRATPVRGADGRILRWYGTSTNIDFQRRHTEVLKRTHEALQQADRRKDEFLATLAHELRNPLAPLRNSVHLLQMSASPETAGKVHAMMQRQIDHLVRLVDDLLEVSRIASGKIELQRAPVELAAVLAGALESSRPIIDKAGHRLDLDIDAEALFVDGDSVRLAQVFSNLLNNAAKYTEPGGHIRLRARRDGDEALVSVLDDGIGIEQQLLPRVFELFVQAESAGSRSQGGLGIGLALVHSLLALHGGNVEAKSAGLGHGSEFVVRLPLLSAWRANDTAVPRAAPAPARAAPMRVLVCDDNRDAADSLASLLEFLGAGASVFYDGAAALQAVQAAAAAERPQLVLLDIGMPAMDGCMVARALRALPGGKELMLVALTGWGLERDRERTHAAGFDQHLVKPVDLQALQALLATVADARAGLKIQLEGTP